MKFMRSLRVMRSYLNRISRLMLREEWQRSGDPVDQEVLYPFQISRASGWLCQRSLLTKSTACLTLPELLRSNSTSLPEVQKLQISEVCLLDSPETTLLKII